VSLFPTPILVGVDRSEGARFALRTATELAGATGSELHLVHVKVTSSTLRGRPLTPEQGEQMDTEAMSLLEEATAEVASLGGEVAGAQVRFGEHTDRVLVRVQDEVGAGLLVIGASGGGKVARALLGGATTGTVRRARGSVLVARDPAAP
jgi:nucleotide-binding universal stress UspA family protein